MQVFGIDVVWLVGLLVILGAAAVAVATVVGAFLVTYFWKTRKILLPQITFALINLFEAPIKTMLWVAKVETKSIDSMREQIVNRMYAQAYEETLPSQRAIFMPQCLRHPKCPAPTTPEGLKCLGCGKCELKNIKEAVEKLGGRFFIAPGGGLVKRMIAKYKPKAVLGVGCHPEIKMGTDLTIRTGIATQVVPLLRDGCVNTVVDFDEVYKAIYAGTNQKPV